MTIPEERLDKLIEIYREHFGISIDRKEAAQELANMVQFVTAIFGLPGLDKQRERE